MAIGTLTVGVAANATKGVASLKGFRKEVKGVKADTTIASRSLQSFTSGLNRVAGPIAAAGAAYFSVRTFKTIAQDLDLVAKQSAKLGVVPVALQGLRHAAEQTGVASQTLDNALSKMTIRASEAAKGGGDAAAAFKELGIDAKAFALLSADQQFIKVAGAMNQQTNQADKLRIATKLFEEEGAALVATLGLGESGLNKMTSEAAALMGNFSAAELAKVEKFNDEMDKLSKLLGGIGSEIVINVAPAASEFLADLREGIAYFKEKEGKREGGYVGAAMKSSMGAMGFVGEYQKWAKERLLNTDYFADRDNYAATDEMRQKHDIALAKAQAREKYETSTDPLVAYQRLHYRAMRGNKIRAGRSFDDKTIGVAQKALGDGVQGFTSFVGDLMNKAESAAEVIRRRPAHVNPLTGLAPLGMSDARRALMEKNAGQSIQPMGPVSDRINRLVDAGGSEGYMALRANQRQARLNPADKAAPKIEKNTDRSAKAAEQLLDFFRKIPAPRSAGPA